MRRIIWIGICLTWVVGCSSRESVSWTPLDDLLKQLADPSADMRYAALREIKQQGPNTAKKAVPQIVAALKDQDSTVRYGAALAVPLCGHDAADAMPTLIELLKDRDALVRAAAANAIPALGANAQTAVSALQRLSQDSDVKARNAAVHALKQIANNTKLIHP